MGKALSWEWGRLRRISSAWSKQHTYILYFHHMAWSAKWKCYASHITSTGEVMQKLFLSLKYVFCSPPPHNHLATPGNWLASPLEVRTHRMRTACLRQRTQHKRVLTSMQTLLYACAVKILLSTHFYPLTAATCLPASSGDGILKLLRAFKLYHQGPVDGCCRGWLLTYLFPISSSLFFRLSLYLFPSLS